MKTLSRLAYAASFPVLTALAFASVAASLSLLTQPDVLAMTAIGAALPWPIQVVWAVTVFAGGVILAYGVLKPQAQFEVLGCLLLGGAYAGYPLALASTRTSTSQFVAIIFLGLAAGLVARAVILRHAPPQLRIGLHARGR